MNKESIYQEKLDKDEKIARFDRRIRSLVEETDLTLEEYKEWLNQESLRLK